MAVACVSSHSTSSQYLCKTAEHGLVPAITLPTRLEACLDHIFIKSVYPVQSVVCDTDITDHKIAIMGLTRKKHKLKPPRLKILIDYEQVSEEMKEVDWTPVLLMSNVNEATKLFLEVFSEIVKKHTKEIKLSRTKYTIEPWITPGLLRCIQHRDYLHLKARKYPNNEIITCSYTRYKNFCNDLLRRLKCEYENKEVEKNRNNIKGLWNTISKICHLKQKKNLPTGSTSQLKDPSDSLNEYNNYFATIGHNLANTILMNTNESEQSLASKC